MADAEIGNLAHLTRMAFKPDAAWVPTTDSAIEPGVAAAMARDAERERYAGEIVVVADAPAATR